MPVVTRRARDQDCPGECGADMNGPSACDVLLEITSSILTARSCDPNCQSCDIKDNHHSQSSEDCEVFMSINSESLELMRKHIRTLYSQAVPVCIEVKGQGPSTGVLLEQWCVQVNTSRSQGCSAIPVSFLTQAVSSFLHFSQLRSWTVACEGTLPFRVFYRVCAPGEDGEQFSSLPDIHTFPSAPLTSHLTLDITVKSLPRCVDIPTTLTSHTTSTDNSLTTATPHTITASQPHTITASQPHTVTAQTNGTQRSSMRTTDVLMSGNGASPVKCKAGDQRHPLTASVERSTADRPVSRRLMREEPTMRTHLPTTSSPVPWAANKRRSCGLNIKYPARPHPPVRSNSCPAVVPSLCLLGTFEESVLNGRLKPCGHVDGFTAELGASGSFRPSHVTLPVEAAYFSVHSEHEGRGSPYLGHIDLSAVGKKGYRVPKKGTFQLTLFNPNKTVVKMYIVTYDLSDMPSLTQTFIRHKTLSKHPAGGIPCLQYLVHLRFHSSKTGHVYLTRNIKLIFARRAPDTMDFDNSQVDLYTVCEGPTQPKYCPL